MGSAFGHKGVQPSTPEGGRPGEKAHAVLVVFVSFPVTGEPAQSALAAPLRAKLANIRLITCLSVNVRLLDTHRLEVNCREKGLAAANLSAI